MRKVCALDKRFQSSFGGRYSPAPVPAFGALIPRDHVSDI